MDSNAELPKSPNKPEDRKRADVYDVVVRNKWKTPEEMAQIASESLDIDLEEATYFVGSVLEELLSW